MTPDLISRVDAVLPGALADLKALIAIPSVSSQPEHAADVRASADQIAGWLRDIGCPSVQVVAEPVTPGGPLGQPAVIASFPAPEGQPTVCLYAHHDVQPTGDVARWTSPPFDAVERDGRLVGRGSADDKGGVAAHLATLRAFDGKPPIGVKLFIEGEEEVGSPSMQAILGVHHDELAADLFVIADSTNWKVGTPALTTTLRGIADCVVEVSTLDHGLHSGGFGGLVPDALTCLCRLLATLHDERGNVAIEGLTSSQAPDVDYPLDRLQSETDKLDGVEWIGDGSVAQRNWNSPACSVLAIDTTRIADASNTLIASARAKVSVRVAPGDTAVNAQAALKKHLLSHAPWGAHVSITDGQEGEPGIIPVDGPCAQATIAALREAWGVEPVMIGQGGAIPLTSELQAAFPGAEVVVTAVGDPGSRTHSLDESLDLGDWRNAVIAEVALLAALTR
ncbi:MAG: dipeptidase [Propionibacteriaceae bacterium]|nr:dipeptidase [Propionibacteriaceae bacterium]